MNKTSRLTAARDSAAYAALTLALPFIGFGPYSSERARR